MMDGRVFVFIPSYRDSETVHTVQCLLDTATHGARVRVAVFLQGDEPFDVVDARVRVRRVDANAARGPCVARAQGEWYPFFVVQAHVGPFDSGCDVRR